MGGVAAIVAAAAAVASTGVGAASAAGAFGKGGGAPKPPPVDTSAIAKGFLPGAKADSAANVGGGMSPEFLANIVQQQSGAGGGLDILAEIQKSLGGGAGGGAPSPDLGGGANLPGVVPFLGT